MQRNRLQGSEVKGSKDVTIKTHGTWKVPCISQHVNVMYVVRRVWGTVWPGRPVFKFLWHLLVDFRPDRLTQVLTGLLWWVKGGKGLAMLVILWREGRAKLFEDGGHSCYSDSLDLNWGCHCSQECEKNQAWLGLGEPFLTGQRRRYFGNPCQRRSRTSWLSAFYHFFLLSQ